MQASSSPPRAMGDESFRRRLLLVCHAYADDGHTGSFRWRSMAHGLRARGWQIDVIAAVDADDDPSECTRHDPVVSVHGVSVTWWLWRWRQRRLQRYLARERNLQAQASATASATAVTDAAEGLSTNDPGAALADVPVVRVGQPLPPGEHARALLNGVMTAADDFVWSHRAIRRARRLASQRTYDAVVATSPSVATQRVAADLAFRLGLPYVAEFRDPWYFGRGCDRVRLDVLTRWLWRRQELACLARASAIVDIAEVAGVRSVEELEAVAPDCAATSRVCIPSGYEPIDVQPVDQRYFRIVYTGWLWPFMPLPSLLRAVARFRNDLQAEDTRLALSVKLELVGVERCFNGVPLAQMLRACGLDDCADVSARCAREQSALLQQRASVLVCFDSVCAQPICIPSKLYHYAQCHGGLLPVGGIDGAMAREARKIAVRTYDPADQAGIVARLHEIHARWREGALRLPSDRHGVLAFEHRIDEMAGLLDRLTVPVSSPNVTSSHVHRAAPLVAGRQADST